MIAGQQILVIAQALKLTFQGVGNEVHLEC